MNKCPRHGNETCEDCEVERLEILIRRYKRMIRELATHIKVSEEAILDCWRAGGEALCERCGLEYLEHPQIPDYPTFHLICTGRVVKL